MPHLPSLEEPLVVFYPGGKKCHGEFFEGGQVQNHGILQF